MRKPHYLSIKHVVAARFVQRRRAAAGVASSQILSSSLETLTPAPEMYVREDSDVTEQGTSTGAGSAPEMSALLETIKQVVWDELDRHAPQSSSASTPGLSLPLTSCKNKKMALYRGAVHRFRCEHLSSGAARSAKKPQV